MSFTSFSFADLARASARRPWRVVGVWLLILVLAGFSAPTLGDALTTEPKLQNNPESVRGFELLESRLRGPRPMTETVIVRSETATVDDPSFRAVVSGLTAEISGLTLIVQSATDYYLSGNEYLVSVDRHATIIPVTLIGDLDDAVEHAPQLKETIDRASAASGGTVEIVTVGSGSINNELHTIEEEDLAKGEMLGIPVALIIMVIVFGAFVAAGIPLVLAIVAILSAIGITAMIGRAFELSFLVTSIITMIGLAVGIDYALFVVDRFREERRWGLSKIDAIQIAGGTASRAVFYSGLTVILALLGLFIVPHNIFRSLSVGAVIVVVMAVAATLTLIPAFLSLLGDNIDWPRRRRSGMQSKPAVISTDGQDLTGGFWGRTSSAVMNHPAVSAALAVSLLVAASLPYLDIKDGRLGVSGLPEGSETRIGFEILEQEFSAGLIAPVEIVVDGQIAEPGVVAGIDRLTLALSQNRAFGPATATANETGDLVLVSVPLSFAPDSQEAFAAVRNLREQIVPKAFVDSPATVLVTGETASNVDGFQVIDDYTPWVFAFVLGLSFLLLMLAFRSVVVPMKAIVMNLLSVGAAYGLLVLVFQKGYGAGFLGLQQTAAIETWLPLFLFSILFGLSMDYHVFLLSRIREHYDQTSRNRESVAVGLRSTSKIITGAAAIMVAVFAGFASGRLVPLQQVGFGLAVAVFLDATIVRSVLVPATMVLLGDRNWYLPRWLGWLPDLRIEAQPVPAIVRAAMNPARTAGDD